MSEKETEAQRSTAPFAREKKRECVQINIQKQTEIVMSAHYQKAKAGEHLPRRPQPRSPSDVQPLWRWRSVEKEATPTLFRVLSKFLSTPMVKRT